jgi:hypothetical protein
MRDELSAARGIVRGVILGALIWAALFAVTCSAAELTVGVNAVSFHTKSNYDKFSEYEKLTPGVYVRYGDSLFVTGGAYRNSFGFPTAHVSAGGSLKVDRWDFTLSVGVTYGYREWYGWRNEDGSTFVTFDSPKVRPLVLPSVGFAIDPEWTVRAFAAPKAEEGGAAFISFAIERKFR